MALKSCTKSNNLPNLVTLNVASKHFIGPLSTCFKGGLLSNSITHKETFSWWKSKNNFHIFCEMMFMIYDLWYLHLIAFENNRQKNVESIL